MSNNSMPLTPASRRAFTLIELLAVFAIMGIVMGIAAGYLRSAGKKIGVAASTSTVETVIRACRDYSRGRGVPSRVVFDRGSAIVWAAAQQTVGEWHFERPGQGYGNPYESHGAGGIDSDNVDRRWGALYDFPDGKGNWIDCGTSTAFDARSGVMVEGWVQAKSIPRSGRMVIFQKGKQFSLSVDAQARLVGEIAVESDDPTLGGKLVLVTENFVLRQDTWWHVALEYDGEAARIHVNFTERAAKRAPGLLSTDEGAPFLISDATNSFIGYVDEVRLSTLAATTRRSLDGGVNFEEDYPPMRFDRDGNLDLRAMEQAMALAEGTRKSSAPPVRIALPVEIVVARVDGSARKDRSAVRVSYYGAITREYLDSPWEKAAGEKAGGLDESMGLTKEAPK